jgi:hypothetical protein
MQVLTSLFPKPPHHDRRATVSCRYRGLETIRPYKIPRHPLQFNLSSRSPSPLVSHTIKCLTAHSRRLILIEQQLGQPSLLFVNYSQVGQASSAPHIRAFYLPLAFRIISYSKTFRNTSCFLGRSQCRSRPIPVSAPHGPVGCPIRAGLAGKSSFND